MALETREGVIWLSRALWGLLFNKWVDCDLETAYELTKIANSVTAEPLPIEEIDRTFTSIARAEYRKRG